MRFNRRMQDDEQVPMASMSDLAFLINVFLMAALLFSANKGMVLELPKSATAEKIQAMEIVVDITQDGKLYAGGRPIELGDVGAYVLAERKDHPERPVVVKSDRRVSYGGVIDVMDELVKVGITDVALPTSERESSM